MNFLNRIPLAAVRLCQERLAGPLALHHAFDPFWRAICRGGFRRRVSGGRGVHGFLDTTVCLAIALSALAPFAPVLALPGVGAESFSAELMLGDRVRPVGFTPLLVSLRTSGPFKGRIHIALKDESSVSCRIPLNVGKGDFRFAIAAPINTQRVSGQPVLVARLLDDRGRIMAERELDLMAIDLDSTHLIISRLGVLVVENPPPPMLSGRPNGMREFAPAWVANLPEDPLLFDAVDFVMASAGVCARLNDAQARALVQWVRSGGTLIVDSAARDQDIARNPLLELLAIELEPERQTTTISVQPPVLTNSRYRRQGGMPYQVAWTNHGGTATNDRSVSVNVNLRPIRCGEARAAGTNALRADVVMGCGRLILTSVDLSALFQNDVYGANAVLYEIMSGHALVDREPELEKNIAFRGYYSYPQQPAWLDEVFEMAGLEEISRVFVIGFLLLFILVVSPVERWVLRRMGLLRWTWLVKVAIVLVFCFVGGWVSYVTRGTEPLRSMLCVHQYGQAGGGRHVWLDCFIPARSRSVKASPMPGGMVCDLSSFGQGSGAICDGAQRDVEFRSPVWGAHFLYSTALHDEPAPFQVAVSNVNGHGTWFVTCLRKDMDVRNVRIVWREQEFQTRAVDGGWLATGSNLVNLAGEDDHTVIVQDARGELMLSLARLEARPVFSETAAAALRPAPLHGWLRSGEWGVILAECGQGLESRMEIQTPRKAALHVVRQVVRRPADTRADAAPGASDEILSLKQLREHN